MENQPKVQFPKAKDHLNKTYLEELGHKLWNTKGTRFASAERLLTINSLSNKANAFLSAYLIIYGLLSVYRISGNAMLNETTIAFSSTALSILLLVFTQMETAEDYKIRAQSFHDCALKVGGLHDKLRLFKTLNEPTKEEIIFFCEETSKTYQKILFDYPNHDRIDFERFRCRHADYYELSKFYVFKVQVKYYLRVKLLYHILIFSPAIMFFLL